MPWRRFMPDWKDKNIRDMMFNMYEVLPEDIRKAVIKYGNRIISIPNGRKWIDVDFEE